MTLPLYLDDPYQRDGAALVTGITQEGGVILDQSIFYPTGGGQPGDSGLLAWDNQQLHIATTVKGQGGDLVLVPSEPARLPGIGTHVTQTLNWDRRHHHMRVHTLLHLLSVVVPFGVTGGQIALLHGRLDFDMPEAPEDRDGIQEALNRLIASDLRVTDHWITRAELEAAPRLIKTMAVQPPTGTSRIRLVQIGDGAQGVDVQPCGGTHVARTGEIGAVRLGKITRKGRTNRRIYVHLAA